MLGLSQIILTITIFSLAFAQLTEKKWWETASFYQIYPRSFQDSDGDGIGDLKGITQKLPYLKEIGVTATWLSPIMKSPMADFGYDVSDFYDIEPIFGTMADFDEMSRVAKELGLKILMDLVPNHSSDECEWFVKSAAGDPEYKDFYVWHPGKIVNGVRQPPTNWISVFRGNMWTWNEQRQAYYLHQFHVKQPDFNYRNPKVLEKMKDVIRFWMRKGVDGLRIDAVPYFFEVAPDADGNYPDAPPNPNVKDPEDPASQLQIYTMNQPGTIELLYEFRKVVDDMKGELTTKDPILLAEGYVSLDILMKYYGNGTVEGAQVPFNTELITKIDKNSNAFDFKRVIYSWMDKMPKGRVANWEIGNHDRNRVATRLGEGKVDMMNILMSVLPGIIVTYYGEELGMKDVYISWEDTVDHQACQSNKYIYETLTRDPARTPLEWNEKEYAGFSTAKPWLPVSPDFKVFNIKNQRRAPRSHLNIFKQVMQLRKQPSFTHGDLKVEALNANVLLVLRTLEGYPSYVTLLNINNNLEVVNLQDNFKDLGDELQYELVTDRSMKRKGEKTSTSSILLMPHETVVLKSYN